MSNDRSPRAVCSTTTGTRLSLVLLMVRLPLVLLGEARSSCLSSSDDISAQGDDLPSPPRAKSPACLLNRLLPEVSLKDVISETRRLIAKRGVTVPAKKATAKKATAKKATAKKATARASSQSGRTHASRAATPSSRAPTLAAPGRSGDLIVIDSPQVGSPAREGEVLEVIHGEVSVSYLVRWADGHQTLIAPKGGSARIVRSSKRA
jgi:Domain of unknown function (DUF1918)